MEEDPYAAIGRRNFMFAGSDDGARRFAMLHALIVNCDLVGAPFEYLRDGFGRRADAWTEARLRELLPAAWLADQRRQQQPSDRAADAVDEAVPAAADRASASALLRLRSRQDFDLALFIKLHPRTNLGR